MTSSAGDAALRGLIKETSISSNGAYHVSVVKDGQQKDEVVDDWIPCVGNEHDLVPAFGQMGSKHTVWSLVLCKAFAKAQGSYRGLFAMSSGSQEGSTRSTIDALDSETAEVMPEAERAGLVPVVRLAQMLGNSALAVSVASGAVDDVALTKDLAKSLADVADATQSSVASAEVPQTLVKMDDKMPRFKFTFAADTCDVEVVFQGLTPGDLMVKVMGNNGAIAHDGPVQQERIYHGYTSAGVLKLQLKTAEQPYTMTLMTSVKNLAALPEFDMEFDSSTDTLQIEQV
jgi:hypothetical protein